jgi:hypothetical protein
MKIENKAQNQKRKVDVLLLAHLVYPAQVYPDIRVAAALPG